MGNPLMVSAAAATLCLISLASRSNQELTAFDCSSRKISKVDESQLLPSCETINKSRTIWADVVERAPPISVVAYRCTAYYENSSWVEEERREMHLGREVCIKAHKTNSIKLLGTVYKFDSDGKISVAIDSGERPEDVQEFDDFHVDANTTRSVARSYSITLSTENGTLDMKIDIVHFGKYACDYSNLSCRTEGQSDGELFWEIAPGGAGTVLYKGEIVLVTKEESQTTPETTYALLQHQEQVFVLKTLGNQTVSKKYEYRTEIEDVYIIPKVGPEILGAVRSGFSGFLRFPKHDCKWKIVYSEKAVLGASNAVDVVKRMCNKERGELLLSYNASMPFQRAVELPRRGQSVLKSDTNGFVIEECVETKVRSREIEECYEDIPVHHDHYLFLKADSRFLTDDTKRVECLDPSGTVRGTVENWKATFSGSPPTCNLDDNGDFHRGWLFIVSILLSIALAAVIIYVVYLIVRDICKKKDYSLVNLGPGLHVKCLVKY